MTATPWRQDFLGGTLEKTGVRTGIEIQGIQEGRSQAVAVDVTSRTVVGASTDYV